MNSDTQKPEGAEVYRVLRLLEYAGPREWVDRSITQRSVKGEMVMLNGAVIREATLGSVPELFNPSNLRARVDSSCFQVEDVNPNKPTIDEWVDNYKIGVASWCNDAKMRVLIFQALQDLVDFVKTP